MNRSSESLMTLKKAITGFVNHKLAEGLSPRSIASYERLLNKWVDHVGDQAFLCVDRSIFDELTYDANGGQYLV